MARGCANDHKLFLRGSGRDSRDKRSRLEKWGIDIKMYSQYVWLRVHTFYH